MTQVQYIVLEGAVQNNLKGVSLRIPLNRMTVICGVSGSGKSSLAFDTLYAEGQRRYVETFSTYTRQFLDRMDRPRVERIEGIPPAIAINQTNPVRTSRSTVGTMTELNDHLKLLFARASRLYCSGCGKIVRRDTPESIWTHLMEENNGAIRGSGHRILITFSLHVPEGFSKMEIEEILARQGYRRIHRRGKTTVEVVQDRVLFSEKNRHRIIEDIEAALKYGRGRVNIYRLEEDGSTVGRQRFSTDLHCPDCDIHYRDPFPNLFSFNSPIGACETCKGFGRTIGIDYDLVVPDDTKTIEEGAVKPWQSESYGECQDDLMYFARRRGVPIDVPWRRMTKAQKRWVLEGEGEWSESKWYGVRRFFQWLETKNYRMHIRVLLSKYRAYRLCPACRGARLKPESLLWRIGSGKGLNIHEVMLLSVERCVEFFNSLRLPEPFDEATKLLLNEIRTRLGYLVEVGLGYLTLDRQSRTLSGGEVQRINLTTALGTSLVNTLFVLDEPSIGLHPRDIGRLIGVLHRLRDAGNTLVVVEHDPDVIRAADNVIEMGPGAGQTGGSVVYTGSPQSLVRSRKSLTAMYLRGEKHVIGERKTHALAYSERARSGWLEVSGAAEHNLKHLDVRIPLGCLVCVTGVSGSGKSTLIHDVIYNAVRKLKHKPEEQPGKYQRISGHEIMDDIVMVDQSPIGKTTRSNPASYVGAFDGIRKLFSMEPLARERGYSAGTFSFNSGKGRCPTCGGNGFERIEMQFLSDVYIRCPDCDGRRYRPEVLDVKLLPVTAASGRSARGNRAQARAVSVADVLEMTVDEACAYFSGTRDVIRTLEPLQDVGLGYVRLGQPVPTLSGGEAQRLKLAAHLAGSGGRRKKNGRSLFLFDEPTTGLHFDDIALLLKAFRKLIKEGNSVVVIEHNLEVIRAADWILDLGPEGGEQGGELVCEGTPFDVMKTEKSHTGNALKRVSAEEQKGATGGGVKGVVSPEKGDKAFPLVAAETQPFLYGDMNRSILIRRAREHNLRNIDVRIPRDTFTVITGVSGSGKSTVAFDILFAEGQRRYLESLNAYARQFVQPASKPDVDGVVGIPPTVAIEQRVSRGGKKSTVATITEIYHFLRLLFTKLGTQYCPECNVPIEPQTRNAIHARIMREYKRKHVWFFSPLVMNRKGYYTDLAKWATAKGFSQLRVDGVLVPTRNWPRLNRFREHSIDLPVAQETVTPENDEKIRDRVRRALDLGNETMYVSIESRDRGSEFSRWADTIFSTKRACPVCGRSFEEPDPRLFSFNSKYGWCPVCYGTGVQIPGFDESHTGEEKEWLGYGNGEARQCPQCGGRRLRPEALAVKFSDRDITEFTTMTVDQAAGFFRSLKLKTAEMEIARDIVAEIEARLSFLKEVGLPYLSLDRAAPTLSSGEAQRIRLASQLGSNLRGVCYILDEPTIGLHVRDNRMLLGTLHRLKERGNTIVVVEHDEETIRSAEYLVDLGPGGGVNGGALVTEGGLKDLLRSKKSVTGRLLKHPLRHPIAGRDRVVLKNTQQPRNLLISNAHLHNLKHLEVVVPLFSLICVTGVSGSGKSTLVHDVLYRNLKKLIELRRKHRLGSTGGKLNGCEGITDWEAVARIMEVDQTPIGKTPRSCPATYVGIWDDVRRLYAATLEARMRGYTPSRFSFNVTGGRCDECAGQGIKKIEMSFLPDVSVVCDVCEGRRFNSETCAVRYKDKSIADVLAMSVDEAVAFFSPVPRIHHVLNLLQDVGLGYLTLGQQSPTLSGGEAQRIKLVAELARTRPAYGKMRGKETSLSRGAPVDGHSLYVLDEPTIGLHIADVEKLIRVLRRLVDAGNTVVIIEHNLDVIAEADWLIDLGPEGGDDGGRIVAQGPPGELAEKGQSSYTARYLRDFLKERSGFS